MTGKVFGNRVPRVEDPGLLRGRGRYVDDLHLPGTAHAAFVRSPHAHALIRSIDKGAAEAHPGVVAVYTLADLRPYLTDELLPVEFPGGVPDAATAGPQVMVREEALYAGECVAIVIAESRAVAEDAAALVEIEWDILPAAGDCKAALAPGAAPYKRGANSNVMMDMKMDYGDVDAAFASAPHVFGVSIFQHRGSAHPIECRGVVAKYDPNEDRITLWTSTQMPNLIHG